MAKLIFGCGYLGSRVARLWRDAGEQVHVATRDGERAQRFAAEGYLPIVADVRHPGSLKDLPMVETMLYAVGYDRSANASMHEVFAGGLQSALDALAPEVKRVIYISSTGVYAQTGGEWVDEESPCEPTREGGRAALAAESVLAAHALGPKSIVLRLAGLYGPGRIPLAETIRRGEPIAAPADGYLNLIHVDDAAAVVLAAEARAATPRMYVVSDGQSVPRREYYEELARLLKAPAPRFAPPPPDSPALVRSASNKRVTNQRMLSELGVTLRYPSYREGLTSIVASSE